VGDYFRPRATPLLVSGGPHFSQKGKDKAKEISLRGPDVARGPYVAPSWSRGLNTCSSMTPDSPDWVTWVKRGLL